MIHPSYKELIEVINAGNDADETPLVTSRYSVVLATSKRARQLIAGDTPKTGEGVEKPLSVAVNELYTGKIHILKDETEEEEDGSDGSSDIAKSIYIGEPKKDITDESEDLK